MLLADVICKNCDSSFTDLGSFLTHTVECPQPSSTIYVCTLCQLFTNKKFVIAEHCQTAHNGQGTMHKHMDFGGGDANKRCTTQALSTPQPAPAARASISLCSSEADEGEHRADASDDDVGEPGKKRPRLSLPKAAVFNCDDDDEEANEEENANRKTGNARESRSGKDPTNGAGLSAHGGDASTSRRNSSARAAAAGSQQRRLVARRRQTAPPASSGGQRTRSPSSSGGSESSTPVSVASGAVEGNPEPPSASVDPPEPDTFSAATLAGFAPITGHFRLRAARCGDRLYRGDAAPTARLYQEGVQLVIDGFNLFFAFDKLSNILYAGYGFECLVLCLDQAEFGSLCRRLGCDAKCRLDWQMRVGMRLAEPWDEERLREVRRYIAMERRSMTNPFALRRLLCLTEEWSQRLVEALGLIDV